MLNRGFLPPDSERDGQAARPPVALLSLNTIFDMKRFPSLLTLLLRLHAALRSASERALCYACEMPTVWTDEGTHYRCAHCGADPLEHAPEG